MLETLIIRIMDIWINPFYIIQGIHQSLWGRPKCYKWEPCSEESFGCAPKWKIADVGSLKIICLQSKTRTRAATDWAFFNTKKKNFVNDPDNKLNWHWQMTKWNGKHLDENLLVRDVEWLLTERAEQNFPFYDKK